ncbi:threonine synthase [Pyrofollis japonicus]|nr:threonine synthase [Pyrofollis japonicus]
MLALKPVENRGEGDTPLAVDEFLGLRVWFKLEYLNPSGSFKDRGALLATSHAILLGAGCVVEDSSGNAGLAVARRASINGLESVIVVPRDAPEGKKKAIKLMGARLVEAENRAAAAELAPRIAREKSCYYVYHLGNPLFVEGLETIAYEVYEQEGVPDAVVVPFGSGGLFLGIYNGFKKLQSLGLARRTPRMIAVQGVEVAPLYERIYGSKPANGSSRLADGIRVPNPPLLDDALKALEESRGKVVAVNDSDIVRALKTLVEKGFIVEPTSAAAVAGLEKVASTLREEGVRDVLLPLTGSGLKMLDLLSQLLLP